MALIAAALYLTFLGSATARCLAIVGIFSVESDSVQRGVHRRYLGLSNVVTFGGNCTGVEAFSVRFVVCSKQPSQTLINEQREYRDLLILPTRENMNDGKTQLFFETIVRSSFEVNHVLKADIDTFIHVGNLVKALTDLGAQSNYTRFSYYGRVIGNFPVPSHGWIMGCIYGMSYDLVVAYAKHSELRQDALRGGEDKVSTRIAAAVSKNLNQTCHWVSDVNIHDHPDCGCGSNVVAFSNQTVAIHQLKALSLWNSTLRYFFGENQILKNVIPSHFPGLRYRTCKVIIE
jgi:hypothetical protein